MRDQKRDHLTYIELDEQQGEACVWIQRPGRSAVVKTIATDDLIAALAKGFQITTGILPSGTKFYAGTRTQYRLGVEVPGKRRTASFSLRGRDPFDIEIPFPDMLFVFEVSSGQLTSSRAFAVRPPLGLPQDRLYLFPYGNVAMGGGVCWGSAASGRIQSAIMLDAAVNKFYSSVFSGHYVWGTNTFNAPEGVGDLHELLQHVKDLDDFPSSYLKPDTLVLNDVLS